MTPRSTLWYRANPERGAAAARVRYKRNREQILARRRANHIYQPEKWRRAIFDKYGMTAEEYDALHEEQAGRCAMCNEPERIARNGRTYRLCVDHDHTTGAIRGLLCRSCNSRLGVLEDEAFAASAERYLARHTFWRAA